MAYPTFKIDDFKDMIIIYVGFSMFYLRYTVSFQCVIKVRFSDVFFIGKQMIGLGNMELEDINVAGQAENQERSEINPETAKKSRGRSKNLFSTDQCIAYEMHWISL